MRHRVQRPQDVVPPAAQGRPHEPSRGAPQEAQERREDEMGRVHEVDLPPAPARLLQAWLQLLP